MKQRLRSLRDTIRRLFGGRGRHRGSHRKGTSSGDFWNQLYAAGGTSGTGSYGRLAKFKAEVLNGFVLEQNIGSVVELGCGDGSQLALANYPEYLGLDVSPAAVARCRARFSEDMTKTFAILASGIPASWEPKEMALSLDVIYHLLEDPVFHDYMQKLFASASRFIVIYSSNEEKPSEWWEVRHRTFTDWIASNVADWELYRKIPQKYPTEAGNTNTSWSDFYIFRAKDTK